MNKILLFFTIFLCSKSMLFGQKTMRQSIRINSNPVLELKIDNKFAKAELNFVKFEDYEKGVTNFEATGLKIKSNRDWVLNVNSNTANFLDETLSPTDIESSKFSVRKSGSDETVEISILEKIIASGTKGNGSMNEVILDFIANPGFIKEGTYTIELTYTLSTP